MVKKIFFFIAIASLVRFLPSVANYDRCILPVQEMERIFPDRHYKMGFGSVFSKGELVFFNRKPGFFEYGIIDEHIHQHFYGVIALSDNAWLPVENKNIRKLAPLWHTIYQPGQEYLQFDRAITDFVARLQPRSGPFLQSLVIEKTNKIVVVGDLHGCRNALAYYFEQWHAMGILQDNLIVHPDYKIIFLGDYADRVNEGAEVYSMLCALQKVNREKVFLCRGNHEDNEIGSEFGFKQELVEKFSAIPSRNLSLLWENLCKLFDRLPHGIFVSVIHQNCFRSLLFSHGGVEPIKGLLQRLLEAHRQTGCVALAYDLVGFGSDNQFNWLDFFAHESDTSAMTSIVSRGGEGWNRARFGEYAATQRGQSQRYGFNYSLDGLVRAHQHNALATQKLRAVQHQEEEWEPLQSGSSYPIQLDDIITIISSPEIYPSDMPWCDVFAIISFDDAQGWLYTPYIRVRDDLA